MGESAFGSQAGGRSRAGPVRSLFASRGRAGRALGVLVGVVLPLAASASASADQVSFSYTGASQFFTVPDRVHSLEIIAEGASGGSGLGFDGLFQGRGGAGGAGASVGGTLAVSPGDQVTVNVGQKGGDGHDWPGDSCSSPSRGGAGGASPSPVLNRSGGPGGDGDGCGGGAGGGGAATDVVVNGATVMVASGGGGGGGAGGFAGFNGGDGGSATGLLGEGNGAAGTGTNAGGGGDAACSDPPQSCNPGGFPACELCDSGGGGGGGGGDRTGGGGGRGELGGGGGGGGGTGGTMVAPVLSDVTIATAPRGIDGRVQISWTPPDPTSTAVSCSPDPVAVDTPTTCTATVTDTADFPQGPPTEAVFFKSDGAGSFADFGICELSGTPPAVGASPSCSVTYTPSATGSQTITARYDGDTIHLPSDSPGETLTVTRRSSSTSVSCSPNAVGAGTPTTCTVTVAGGPPAPTGTVRFGANGPGQFSDGECTLAGSGPSSTCSVTFTPSAMGGTGARMIDAVYGGDATYDESGGRETVTVLPATSTRVSCSPGTVATGRPTTCMATVTTTPVGGAPRTPPTGLVRFASIGAGRFSQPNCVLLPAGPSATCSVTYTPDSVGTGAHAITADYRGDANHGASSGSGTVAVIAPRSTSTNVSCSPDTVAVGAPSSCTATVTDTAGGSASTPTGTVGLASNGAGSFNDDQCTLEQTSPGVAGCSVSYTPGADGVPRNTDTITATYGGGDATHAASSGTAAVTVQPTSKADCRGGGWRNYGFQNQRQCIQFVGGLRKTAVCAGQKPTIVGTSRSDRLRGTNGDDVIDAGGGNDKVVGLEGDDLVCGAAGSDLLRGSRGDDTLRGGQGSDELVGGRGSNRCRGGRGSDDQHRC